MASVNEEAARQLFEALARMDVDTYGSLVADDAVEGRPQLGERFIGRDNIVGMYRDVPGDPQVTWRTISGGGETWVAEGRIDYGTGGPSDHIVAVTRIQDGKMVTSNVYFASHIDEPVPYHTRWSEPHDFDP